MSGFAECGFIDFGLEIQKGLGSISPLSEAILKMREEWKFVEDYRELWHKGKDQNLVLMKGEYTLVGRTYIHLQKLPIMQYV